MANLTTSVVLPPSAAPPAPAALPRWPLLGLFYGFPLVWIAGLLQFAPAGFAFIMLVLLVLRRHVEIPAPMWMFAAFLTWAATSFGMLSQAASWTGFTLRWTNLFTALVFMVYYYNARDSINHHHILRGVLVVWGTTVVLGCLALMLPDVRLTTPVGMLMPGSLTANDLVKNWVFPPLAEVQHPWGAPEPYVRPSAPFAYANSWGVAFVVLTPLVVAHLVTTRFRWQHLLIVVGLAVSLIPAVGTSNRGMFIGSLISMVYVVSRWLLQGRLVPAIAGAGLLFGVGAWLALSGAVAEILGRQEFSDSTGGRAALYEATLEATLRSPLLGYGAPRLEESVGVFMGTQGYLWTIMFSYGFVGLVMFMAFLWGSTLVTARFTSAAGALIHSVPVAASAIFVFYGLGVVQFIVVGLCLAMLLRSRRFDEKL